MLTLQRNLACLAVVVFATLPVAVSGTGYAAAGSGPRILAEQPELDHLPYRIGPSRLADSEADVHVPASIEMTRLVLSQA